MARRLVVTHPKVAKDATLGWGTLGDMGALNDVGTLSRGRNLWGTIPLGFA
jgi:hypothetical protein